jgi:hypothetical protein
MRAKLYNQTLSETRRRVRASLLPYTPKIENAEASLTKIFPAVASVKRYNKPDVNSRRWPSVFPLLQRMSRLRFAVPARIAHPRWRVSQARLRWAADLRHSDRMKHRSGMSCGESLVSSVTQTTLSDFRQTRRPGCEGFSRPFRSLTLRNGTVRILAEPSNNNNLRALRQLSGSFLGRA